MPRQIKALLPRRSTSSSAAPRWNCSATPTASLRATGGTTPRASPTPLRARRRAGGAAGEHQRHGRPGLAGHRAGGQRRRARGHQLHQPHGQQLREHAQFDGDREHHGRGRPVHAGRADAAAEAHQRGGRPPEPRRGPREHPLPGHRRRGLAGAVQGQRSLLRRAHQMRPRLTIDDVSGPAEGLFVNDISARVGDNLLTSAAAECCR